jgi:PglZ domain
MLSPLTPAVVRQHVRAIHDKRPNDRVIGIRTRGGWSGPPSLDIDGVHADVVPVVSPLQARELISDRDKQPALLVLLTDLSDEELGTDVVCRLAMRQLMIPDPWSLVIDAFKARDLDPRLLKHRWMAAALLEGMPPGGYAPMAAGVLDSETAWGFVLGERLGLRVARPDASALLDWLSSPGSIDRLNGISDEMRAGVRDWLADSAGAAGLAMLDASASVSPADVVALGLVCTALFASDQAPYSEARDAVIRLEPFIGGRPLTPRDGRAWATAALALVNQRGQDERRVRTWCDRADALLADLGAGESRWRSDVLPRGFEQRCERAAAAIQLALAGAGTEVPALHVTAVAALDLVRTHRLATLEAHGDRIERLTMALRLVRWLRANDAIEPGSLALAARRYVDDISFADWARTVIRGGDPSPLVSSTCARVVGAVRARREAQEARFAALLAGWFEMDPGGVLVTERVLAEVVAPVARSAPVLVLVVDGMNTAVFHELAGSILQDGWVPIAKEDQRSPDVVVALLPSVTECCRASLLAGTPTRGTAADERSAFQSHALLLAESRPGKPPVLFHKGSLADTGEALAPAVRGEIAALDRRIVAVVVNAVDDHLLKADQVRTRWTLPNVPVMRALLHAAYAARRAVVLTADHGHVLETGSAQLPGADADRWRPADSELRAGEARFGGPRVLTDSHTCIAAVTESVRYRAKKNGYHGGATAQEVVVALAVFAPAEVAIDGWQEVGLVKPEWWDPAGVVEAPRVAEAGPPAPPAKAARPLLRIAEQAAPAPALPVATADRLLASEVFKTQREHHARMALDDGRIRVLLEYLLARGGRSTRAAVAARLGLPLFRVSGHLTALRTLLNVDAYPVLSVDEASDSVELNVELLRTQFEL